MNDFYSMFESIDGRMYAFHCTDTDPRIIMEDGFDSSSDNSIGFTEENQFSSLYDKYLPSNPCFISRDSVWNSDAKYKLKIDITGLELFPDFGHLLECNAYYDEEDSDGDVLFWWKGNDWRLLPVQFKGLSDYLEKTGGYLHSYDFTGEMSWRMIGTACVDGDFITKGRIVEINGKPIEKESSIHVNESVYDDSYLDIESQISEFKDDKEHGIRHKQWRLIGPEQYEYALKKFIKEGPELFTFSEKVINDWLSIIVENTQSIDALGVLDGRDELNVGRTIDYSIIVDEFPEEYEKEYNRLEPHAKKLGEAWLRSNAAYGALDNVGFYDWAVLPDGNSADSDNGVSQVMDILSDIDYDSPISDKLIAINRCIDVFHRRSDWSSAFIKGGKSSLDKIASEKRYMATAYPMDESFEGMHQKAVENILDSNQLKHFCNGISFDEDGIYLKDEMINEIMSEESYKLFEFAGCRPIDLHTHIKDSPLNFEINLFYRNPRGMSDKLDGFIRTNASYNIKNGFGSVISGYDFGHIGEHDYRMIIKVTNPKVVNKIIASVMNPQYKQMDLFKA